MNGLLADRCLLDRARRAVGRPWLVAIFGLMASLSMPAHAEVAATVVFSTGAPRIVAATGSVRPLLKGSELSSGEMVDTVDGRVQLRFRDGASVSLQPGTQFRVDEFRLSGEGGRPVTGDGVVMSLVKGALRTVSGLLGKENRQQYRLDTSVATIGIRGTSFGVNLDSAGLTVSTYAGLVEVCSQTGCVQVAPAETVFVSEPGALPRRQSGSAAMSASGAVPDLPTPVNQPTVSAPPVSAPPVAPVAPPVQPVTSPTPPTTAPLTAGPYR